MLFSKKTIIGKIHIYFYIVALYKKLRNQEIMSNFNLQNGESTLIQKNKSFFNLIFDSYIFKKTRHMEVIK